MKPLAWSPSRLSDFVNCPRSFHAKNVLKLYPYVQTEEAKWGEWVHKQFEKRQKGELSKLPQELEAHEDHMIRLSELGRRGHLYTERKVALDRTGKPCGYFAKDKTTGEDIVWTRAVIDLMILDGRAALIEDYKTGKKKPEFRQLKQNALWVFAEYAHIDVVRARYYWTTDRTLSAETYTRDMIPALWAEFIPDLKQYAQAFKEDVWQPRQSGLCGWCPVTTCEFWKPKRRT